MEIFEVIRAIMKARGVKQEGLSKALGVKQHTLSAALMKTPKQIEDRIAMLDYLGYELIVREKRQGRRAEGEYVITAGEKK